jgi:hypothetical protein
MNAPRADFGIASTAGQAVRLYGRAPVPRRIGTIEALSTAVTAASMPGPFLTGSIHVKRYTFPRRLLNVGISANRRMNNDGPSRQQGHAFGVDVTGQRGSHVLNT